MQNRREHVEWPVGEARVSQQALHLTPLNKSCDSPKTFGLNRSNHPYLEGSLNGDHVVDLVQKPQVDHGQFVDFLHGITTLERHGHGKHAAVGWVRELKVEFLLPYA